MKKKNIAVIAGGFSGEAKVSRKGASVVVKNLDRKKYNVYLIFIYKNKWFFKDDDDREIPVDKNDFSLLIKGKKVRFDCIFNVIHGTPGEDGKLQGYFDILGIPYINSNLTASSITFNKFTTGIFASQLGIKIPESVLLKKQSFFNNISSAYSSKASSFNKYSLSLAKKLGMPLIVKPNNGGSSIGMSRVDNIKLLNKAIDKAFYVDDEVIVQEFINGTEITCGLIRKKGEVMALPLTEVVSSNSFFDYEAKYAKGKSKEITPAPIPDYIADECKKISLMIYNNLNCKGMVRMDYIIKKLKANNKFFLYLLDINTVPGLSNASIVPKQAAVAGISLSELYDIVIDEALIYH